VKPPLPPPELASRVGVNTRSDVLGSFDEVGRDASRVILETLPEGWALEGKRVLDFGSGPGKVLRHLVPEHRGTEFHACDIHEPSIGWLRANLPGVQAFVNEEWPPLALPDGAVDLVWAMSVFTHITDAWADWLVDLHRVLDDDGLLLVSFLGRSFYERFTGEAWDESSVGMTVISYGLHWDLGGPLVFLSPWWIEEHWGRAFEVVSLRDGRAPGDHGIVLLRKRPGSFSPDDLRRVEPGDERELAALRGQIRELHREVVGLRGAREDTARGYEGSLSWRVTAPLRRAGELARRRRRD
jgi:SAM-dependent methyltransferase